MISSDPICLYEKTFNYAYGTVKIILEDRRPDSEEYCSKYKLQVIQDDTLSLPDSHTAVIAHFSKEQWAEFVNGIKNMVKE